MSLSVVILAAGQGTRMRSDLPKVLHPLADKPLLQHVIETAQSLDGADIHVVYGHGGDRVPETLGHMNVDWIKQDQQLGTGHAVAQAMPHIAPDHLVLVLYGDVPLIAKDTLEHLISVADGGFGLLTVSLDDPTGYGRIVRDDDGKVVRIVEHKDADDAVRQIREVNTGILVVPRARLSDWLERLDNDNVQGEYYLTDVIAMAVSEGMAVNTVSPAFLYEVLGVNNKKQLAELERHYQRRCADALMLSGVTLRDPSRLDIRGDVNAGRDVTIDINVVLEGRVELGDRVSVGPHCVIRNCQIGDGVTILAHSMIEDAVVGADSRIGPFARIRPGTVLSEDVHIGNFVEVKNASVGAGSKVNHLSYVGDARIGSGVNIGAGTITCNYDGANKHLTEIGDNVFVGSDTQLVAPVKVGDGATIGAGTTVTRDVPPNILTLSRPQQAFITGWRRPTKKDRQGRE